MNTALAFPDPGDDITVLTGNGLSVAANPEMTMPKLTTELVTNRFSPDEAHALAGLVPGHTEAEVFGNFELLLNPYDAMSGHLDALTSVETLVSGAASHVEAIKQMLRDERRLGVGHTLQIISERAHATPSRRKVVDDLLNPVFDLAGAKGRVTLANLNYDNLVAASCVNGFEVCDMADGRYPDAHEVAPGHVIVGHPLRIDNSFLPTKGVFLQLHGSLSWLRDPATGRVWKFESDSLRNMQYWKKYRMGETQWAPEVVLTNQSLKTALVRQHPFALGYDMFAHRLLTSSRWLIVGYSFEDECVNDVLARVLAAKAGKPPLVLVVGHGGSPAVDRVHKALLTDTRTAGSVMVSHLGFPNVLSGKYWAAWKAGAWASLYPKAA